MNINGIKYSFLSFHNLYLQSQHSNILPRSFVPIYYYYLLANYYYFVAVVAQPLSFLNTRPCFVNRLSM